jgi:hypothetical protein
MRVRSRWFVLTGALGGLVGFALMEGVSRLVPGAGTRGGDILRMSIYFAGFGLAVGAALGMTEGAVLRRPARLIYGLLVGLVLGAVGGFAGGAAGQFIYGLVPPAYASHAIVDIAISLDASGSMGGLWFFGNDPRGKRKEAAKLLIDRVPDQDRIAVIEFNSQARMLYPLSLMSSAAARDAAKDAAGRVGAWDGTNLSAGLDTAIQELMAKQEAGRRQYVIFLTDGIGDYTPETARRAHDAGITIYTVGLGKEVSASLLESIAATTGGRYFPVDDAAVLTSLFDQIFTRNIDMASGGALKAGPGSQPLTEPAVLLLLRVVSWAVMGLAIGIGQGVRENTREDLRACALGGLLGGAVGGALFDPVTSLLAFGSGLAGRALADVTVGACIGGSMRLAQAKLVEAPGRATTTLLAMLPKKDALVLAPDRAAAAAATAATNQASGGPPARPAGGAAPRAAGAVPPARPPAGATPRAAGAVPQRPVPSATVSQAAGPQPLPRAASPAAAAPPSLASFEAGNDRERAMALAYRSGHYGLREIAQHFGVPASAVKRAVDQHGLR